jgi:leucyl/phenylalanyl-tRNA--protein transferase
MYYLTNEIEFPDIDTTSEDGLLAIGGDLSEERLLLAYRSGIFPWYEEGQPVLWWSPDPRMVLFPSKFKVSGSMKKLIKSISFKITFDTCFKEVISNCSSVKRKGQTGTWITTEMESAYIHLHQKGHARSVEVWYDEKLVGGLYGIDLPEHKIFCGESMFSKESDASKIGLYYLIEKLKSQDYKLIDCQMYTQHLKNLGAEEITRKEFQKYLSL